MNFQWLSIFILAFQLVGIGAFAQLENNYIPRTTFDKKAKDLKADIQAQLKRELEETPKEDRKLIESYFELKTKYLIHLVESGYVIDDDAMQNLVDSIFNQLARTNKINKKPRITLIIKSPVINATCYGDGVFAVSVGLLSRMDNVSQLAFVLAHELAHYENDHVKNKILQLVRSDYENKLKSNFKRLWESDDSKPEEIEEIQKLVYESRNFSREKEFEADSIGLQYLKNAGFAEAQALRALDKLDSVKYSKHHIGLRVFLPLDNKNFLLEPEWMRSRLSVYSKQPPGSFLFTDDSLKTHPEFELRKGRLQGRIGDGKEEIHAPEFNHLIAICDFEVLESLYWFRQADRALLEALELLTLYPRNEYLVSMVSKILIRTYDGTIYIPTYTFNYDETLRLVNNFLQNTTQKEKGEIAYHFLNNQSNFNPQSEEHYYLLWKVCSLTERKPQKNQIKSEYKKNFPDGKYAAFMKDSYSLSDVMKRLNHY